MTRTRLVAALFSIAIAFQSACTVEQVKTFAAEAGIEITDQQAQSISDHYSADIPTLIRQRWAGTGHGERAVRIARCESGFNPTAQNRSSTAYGVWQFLNATWKGTGIQKTSDPRLQIEAAYRLWKARGWSPWVCRG
jgi:hypothetical protein